MDVPVVVLGRRSGLSRAVAGFGLEEVPAVGTGTHKRALALVHVVGRAALEQAQLEQREFRFSHSRAPPLDRFRARRRRSRHRYRCSTLRTRRRTRRPFLHHSQDTAYFFFAARRWWTPMATAQCATAFRMRAASLPKPPTRRSARRSARGFATFMRRDGTGSVPFGWTCRPTVHRDVPPPRAMSVD